MTDTPAISTRRYAGATAQERTAARRDQLLTAALATVAEGGVDQLTVTGVCARAGLTERYFYESFANRYVLIDELVAEMAAQHAVEIFAAAAMGPPDPQARVRMALEATIDAFTADTPFGRVVSDLVAQDAFARHRASLTRRAVEQLARYASVVFGPGERDDARLRLGLSFLVGGCAEIVADFLSGRLDVTRDEVVDVCSDCAYAGAAAIGLPADRASG